MTSADFHVCYASVTDTLFEYIEQDLTLLTTALLDDDDDDDLPERALTTSLKTSFPPARERRFRGQRLKVDASP
ncbi:hypothetical protein AB2N08_11445 [Massilia aurea]|uniref:hypothetical protein n=1 Tax=Massilia aurea TaxID=373040 RepID=UPI003462CFEF